MKEHILMVCIGYFLDRILGDPHNLWHPVQGIGKIIELTEGLLWKLFRLSPKREEQKGKKRLAGGILVFVTILIVIGIAIGIFILLDKFCPKLKIVFGAIICYQMLAKKSLRTESMKVYDALMGIDTRSWKRTSSKEEPSKEEKLQNAREAVAMIVGRDTQSLSEEGIIKATVETVAENTSDGVIAPLLYMILFGPIGALVYKTINTMDSMIGYRNDRYLYFGTAAAKLDDIVNFIPSRLSAFLMIEAAGMLAMDRENAWKIYKRDRLKHPSPNSAQTEAVCAGALNIELAGPACYFGVLHDKPTIGDAKRSVETEDIKRANRLMDVAVDLMFLFFVIVAMAIYIKAYR